MAKTLVRPDHVWVEVSPGRKKRVLRSVAEAEDMKYEEHKPHPSVFEVDVLKGALSKVRGRHGHRGLGTGFLNAAERKSLQNYLGVPVESAQDARRVMKQKGMHFAEKGEYANDMMDALLVAGETGKPVDERYNFAAVNPLGAPDVKEWSPERLKDRIEYHTAECRRRGIMD